MGSSRQSSPSLPLSTLARVTTVCDTPYRNRYVGSVCSRACAQAGMVDPVYFVAVGLRGFVCIDAHRRILYVRVGRGRVPEWSWQPALLSRRMRGQARRVLQEYWAVCL